jgi:capsular exopolysaccharide synthesis family protein
MNQPLTSATSTRAPAQGDAPDILQVVRRYVWLLAAGTAVGAILSGGLYYYLRKNYPRYRSFYTFQVVPQPGKLGESNSVVMNNDDTSQFIHRQVRYIKSQYMLQQILDKQEFRDSKWYQEHLKNPLKALAEALEVSPLVDSASFELGMVCRSPEEARILVEVAKETYKGNLRDDSRSRAGRDLSRLDDIVRNQQTKVRSLTDDLNQMRQRLNVPAIESRYTVELQQLQQMNTQKLQSDNLANSAQDTLRVVGKQFEDGTLKNTPEAIRYVNENGMYIQLEMGYRGLMQERAALLARVNASSTNDLKTLDARIAENRKQSDELRAELEKRAMEFIKNNAELEYSMRKAQADYITELRNKKEQEFQALDANRNEYTQKTAELKAQEEVLEKLRIENQYRALDSNTDEARINELVKASIPQPDDIVWPNAYLFLSLGTLGGLGVAFLTAYLLALSDTRVRTPRDITRTLQLPLLGFIPDEADDRAFTGEVGTALITAPNSMVAESFRQIRSQLLAQTENSPVNTLLVASIAPGGGSTTVASNLAASMALNDRRVLLVDANFYRPSVKGLYKNVPAEGLSDVLRDPSLLGNAIVASPDVPKLHILGAGSALAKASSELLEGKAFRELMDSLRSKYDLVIFDGAPLNLVADSMTLAAKVDGVVSVIRAGEVSRGTVARIREGLRQVHANLLGFVLNAAQTTGSGYFKENYKTFYRYAGQGARRPAPAKSR